jgi:hypothetical protein
MDYTAVSMAVKRFAQRLGREATLRKLTDRLLEEKNLTLINVKSEDATPFHTDGLVEVQSQNNELYHHALLVGAVLATGVLRAAKVVWRHRFDDDRPFQREFEGIQKFERISREHPSQLALFHIGRNEAQGYFYYVMELADDLSAECGTRSAEGEDGSPAAAPQQHQSPTPHSALRTSHSYVPHTLRADLAQGRLPTVRALEIGLALTEALAHLHRHGLVHRDVKPSNVIFVNGRPKLADIGLVTDASDQCSIVGTEGYLPPEGPGTPKADIFSLGKVLYEISTAQDRRCFPDLPPDLKGWPDAPAVLELNEIVLKACAADAQQRYESADAMHTDLARLAAGKSVRRARQAEHRWRVVQRAAAGLTIAAALLGLIALASRIRQVTDDTGAHPQPLNRVAAIGPEIDLAFPAQKLVLALRYEYEFLSDNRAQGHTVALVLTKRL